MTEEFQNKKEITADEFIELVAKEINLVITDGEQVPVAQARDIGTTIRIEEENTRLCVREDVTQTKITERLCFLKPHDVYYLDFVNIEFFGAFEINGGPHPKHPTTFTFKDCGFYTFTPQTSLHNLSISIIGGIIQEIHTPNIHIPIHYRSCTIKNIEINSGGPLREALSKWVFTDVTFWRTIGRLQKYQFFKA